MGRPENYYADDAPKTPVKKLGIGGQASQASLVSQAVATPTQAPEAERSWSGLPYLQIGPQPGATAAPAPSAGDRVSAELAKLYGLNPAFTDMLYGSAKSNQSILDKFPGLVPTSGYRDPEYNIQVGGVPGSGHVSGLAADFAGDESLMAQALAYAKTLPDIDEAMIHDAGSGRHLHTSFKSGSETRQGDHGEGLTHEHGEKDIHTHVDPNQASYSVPDQVKILQSVGFSPEAARTMAAIGMAESSGDPTARALTKYEDSRGLYQINLMAHPQYKGIDMSDPYENAKAAYEVSNGGTNFRPWTMYTNGGYQQYLDGGGVTGGARSRSNTGAYEQSSATQGVPGLANAVSTYEQMNGLSGTGASAYTQALGRAAPLTQLMSDARQQGINQQSLIQSLLGPDDSSMLSNLSQLYSFLDAPGGP